MGAMDNVLSATNLQLWIFSKVVSSGMLLPVLGIF
jgi:hypothetical protein